MSSLGWGIASASGIARRFISALKSEGQNVVAVAARDKERAAAYAAEHGIPMAYGGYEELFADPAIDVVYVSNTNNAHAATVLAAIEAGKHVICEKPLSTSSADTAKMISAARERGVFFSEALWSRFLPIYVQIREIISSGKIGRVNYVAGDFSFTASRNSDGRLLNPVLGGGALYDIGIYSAMFILDILGDGVRGVTASGYIGATGVDEASTVILNYGEGVLGVMSNCFISDRPQRGEIFGTKGRIVIPNFYGATKATVHIYGEPSYEIETENVSNKFIYQIRDFAARIEAGELESPLVPHAHSLTAAKIIERALEIIGSEV